MTGYVCKQWLDKRFDIKELYKCGFVKSATDYEALEKRVCEFFGLQNIFQYDFLNAEWNKLKAKNIFSEN